MPSSPWVLAQTWEDVLFLHWEVEVAQLRRAVPPALEIDTFEGAAWLTITPLLIRASRPRGVPPLVPATTFPEVNVRTYASLAGKPGVYFLSLDATSALAVFLARAIYRLPYRHSRIAMLREDESMVVRARRRGPGPPTAQLDLHGFPLSHLTSSQDALFWPPRRIPRGGVA